MKIITTVLLAAVLLFFGAKVKVLDSTSQQWFGGQYESGKGTDYTLTLKARGGSDKLVIDKLWVGEDLYEVVAVKDLARRSNKEFKKRDTIYVRAGKKLKPDENGNMINVSAKNVKAPVEFSSPALLVYTWKGKEKYLEIEDFRVLEKIIYP